ncbi:VOC family protein [Leisingera sp. ANG-M7]|uniref:VOC family protein n=1 Tax=Leisingera sp. ANG-M7 TaxID=1577902 RepID=UPI00069109AD|nr:VOC family protein [Leisingera sp. ANG-M7]
MQASKTGQIVWHDLFTPDRTRAMDFYRQAAGWNYQTEQAADFAWGGGEKAFVLALLDGEAGAGFAETPPGLPDGWIPYAEVADVDAAAAQAEDLGGDILRSPFEVPGVGRNALLRDPLGALLGISLSRHSFPAPARQFGPEIYLSNGAGFPAKFYAAVCGWQLQAAQAQPQAQAQAAVPILGPSNRLAGWHLTHVLPPLPRPAWVPNIKTASAAAGRLAAEALGARFAGEAVLPGTQTPCFLLQTPGGATAVFSTAPARGGPVSTSG